MPAAEEEEAGRTAAPRRSEKVGNSIELDRNSSSAQTYISIKAQFSGTLSADKITIPFYSFYLLY